MKIISRLILLMVFIFSLNSCSEDDTPTISLPKLLITDAEANEGKPLIFTVTLSEPSEKDVTFNYITQDISTSASDYSQVLDEKMVTLAPGETSVTIKINAYADNIEEDDETFKVVIFDAVNATIEKSDGFGTIKNVLKINHYMTAKVGNQQWSAMTGGGFFGVSFSGKNLSGFGTDYKSYLSISFENEVTGPNTFTTHDSFWTMDENNIVVTYYPQYSTGTDNYYRSEIGGGELTITKYDLVNNIVEGNFSFVLKFYGTDEKLSITEGKFSIAIE